MAKIRKQKGLSQAELADLVGVEQPTISRLERKDEGATLRQYKRVAEKLNISLAELFADDREAAEMAIISAFRRISPERRAGWLDMAQAIATDQGEPQE